MLSARFSRIAARTAAFTGSWKFLALCVLSVAVWIALGPFVGFPHGFRISTTSEDATSVTDIGGNAGLEGARRVMA